MTEQTQNKKHLGVVICGHVDAGKSTTTGHLLFELGGIDSREMEKLKEEAEALGKGSFAFAFYMDRNKEERERGVTISCRTKEFFTDKYHYSVIDAPGHRDFIKNMISGASQADVAILMVPANLGGFEKSIAKGNHKKQEVQGQTRQHARLIHLLGIEQVIVGINKMDEKGVDFSEERYNEIKNEVSKMLTKIGFKTKKIPFIPMSGFLGHNLTTKSDKMPWYKGFEVSIKKKKVKGHTLLDALNDVAKPPKRHIDKPFRLPVSNVLKIKGVGSVITGRIEQGKLTKGDAIAFAPSGINGCKAFSIEMHHRTHEYAVHGDNVGINVKGLTKDFMPKTGDIMYVTNQPDPMKCVESFTVVAFCQDHPGQLRCTDKHGKGGWCPSVHIRTSKAPCQMTKINWKLGKATGGVKVENPLFIEAGDQCEAVFTPRKPFCVDTFDNCKGLGRVAMMDSNSLVMLGRVMALTEKKD
jgi:elongation factor 1-alpha